MASGMVSSGFSSLGSSGTGSSGRSTPMSEADREDLGNDLMVLNFSGDGGCKYSKLGDFEIKPKKNDPDKCGFYIWDDKNNKFWVDISGFDGGFTNITNVSEGRVDQHKTKVLKKLDKNFKGNLHLNKYLFFDLFPNGYKIRENDSVHEPPTKPWTRHDKLIYPLTWYDEMFGGRRRKIKNQKNNKSKKRRNSRTMNLKKKSRNTRKNINNYK